MKSGISRVWPAAIVLAVLLSAAVIAVGVFSGQGSRTEPAGPELTSGEVQDPIARGAYLARAGNCIGCHTARGGRAFAGGRGIETPFGTVYSRNLTPHGSTGLGTWNADDFWRALHEGSAKGGRLLYPACPFPSFTHVTRQDVDALYAFFRSLPAVERANKENTLRFPYNTQSALEVWRTLFFKPGEDATRAEKSAQWNRGAYLVNGLGHCAACHAPRNAFGATREAHELGGAIIPMQKWYAPALMSSDEVGVSDWKTEHLVQLLKTGVSPQGAVAGPMAEVVFSSTQYLSDADLQAMAMYLQDAPKPAVSAEATSHEPVEPIDPKVLESGARLYDQQCEPCHGKQGQGASHAYPALASSRAVMRPDPTNLVRIVVSGGFPPATQGNPQPYGMPPFGATLTDIEIAAVVTYIRNSWGNQAPVVTDFDVMRAR